MITSSFEQLLLGNAAMELLAVKEIDQHLETLPEELVKSINKESAIAYVINVLSPLQNAAEDSWFWQQEKTQETLGELISDAAALSVLRLLFKK
ncbi:hypothetical protein BCD67_23095 [Oscillatoriales cyanobacterium USR001]|nr:hypothetical protein BCD67_23095 [Oscillatoriales cyanobacterium USR001]